MKKYSLLLFCFYSTLLVAQKVQPSQVVQGTFKQMYPNATDVDWEFEENLWEAEFDDEEGELEVLITENGEWLETIRELRCRDLPSNIKMKIKTEYPTYRIDEIEQVWLSDFKGYRIELEKRKSEISLLVEMDGTISKVTTEDDDD